MGWWKALTPLGRKLYVLLCLIPVALILIMLLH